MKPTASSKPDIADTLGLLRPQRRSRRLKQYLVLSLAIIVAIIVVVAVRTRNDSDVRQYKTEEVRRGDLTVVVTATGTLQPKNKVDVGCELSGTVKSVEVDYNSRVKTGQVLARLDTSKLEATITQSRAALESAKAKVLEARATVAETKAKLAQLQKVRELSNGKVPSQSDMDAAVAAFDRAKADTANCEAATLQAQATLQANEIDLFKSSIRSPINGIVLTRSVDPGQTVAAAMTTPVLFTIAEDLAQMDLHVNVDEADVGKIREGQKSTFSVAGYPNRTFAAQITQARFGSSITSGVVTYETVLKVNNSDLALRPGMTATADIVVEMVKNVLLVPGAALRFAPPVQEETAKKSSGGLIAALLPHPPQPTPGQGDGATTNKAQQKVWVMKAGKLSPIPITVGSSSGGMTEVVAGDIQDGMAIVVDIVGGTK
jgi:HlyD family secretion protein